MTDRRPRCPAQFAPFDREYLADPYPVFDAMRTDGGVHHDPELDVWVLTRYADIEAVFRDPELFSAANAQDPIEPLDELADRVPDLRLVDQEYTFHPNVSFRGPQQLVVVP